VTDHEIYKAEQDLARVKQLHKQEQQKQEFESATARCTELVNQRYWKRTYASVRSYDNLILVNLYRITKLTPGWWGALVPDGMGNASVTCNDLKISGTIEHLSIPILPSLINSEVGQTSESARGVYKLDAGPVTQLRVKLMTKKEAKDRVPCWIRASDTLLIPMTIAAAPILSFHEKLSFFDGFKPSTEDEFKKGLTLIRDFAISCQTAFPNEDKIMV
jgi:hypothetical protein